MTFLETSDGSFVRIDRIREVLPKCKSEVILMLEGGVRRSAPKHAWRNALWSLSHHVVPAAPGTVLLNIVRGCGQPWILRQPVLAWGVGPGGFADAVTSTGVFRTDYNCPAILTPDGRVEDQMGFYESYEQWLEEVLEEMQLE